MDRLSNSSDYKIHHHNKRMSQAAAAAVQSGSAAPVYVRKSSTGPRGWFSQTLNRLRGTATRRGGPARRHYLANSLASPNSDLEHSPGVSRRYSSGPKRLLTGDAQDLAASLSSSDRRSGCRWTFVFDPSGRLAYYWSMVVSTAFLYNLWVIVYRFSFQEINRQNLVVWFPLDYFADFLYICDIAFNFRTGYLEDGVLQTETLKLRQHYMNTTLFYVDCLCLLPLDFLYLSLGFNSALRGFRLVKIYRFWVFLDKSERHTNYPNVFRSAVLIHYLLVLFHWNACIFYLLSSHFEFRADWAKTEDQSDTVRHYMHSLYWSTLFLTNIGDIPRPLTRVEYIFVITELIVGLLLFATVLGHVANIVTSVSAARKEFQAKLDNVKTYMNLRRVPDHLQKKVIKWFDYLWLTKKSSDEEKAVMSCLPDKLKAEIAIHVHLDTLKRVEIFQNTEAGFLCELVLRLRPVLFSPGDYICRKGEVGKEMYIVARGKLQVVADNGRTVLATLRAGSYFGEISVLNMGTLGNRRTASVRSVGYSDLFCLSKQDMWDVLQEYPAARVRLEGIAQKRLSKYEKSPLEHGPTPTINRSQSTPGLVEPHLHPDENPTMDRATFVPIQSAMSMPSGLPRTASSMTPIEESQPMGQSPPATAHIVIQPSLHQTQSEPPPMSRPTLSVPSALPLASSQAGAGYHSPQPHSMYNLASTSAYTNHLAVPSRSHRSLSNGQSRSTTPGTMSADDARSLVGNSTTEADFVAEIQRLRERLAQLEAENSTLNTKLNQQQWEVEHRLQEIEMHICGSDSPSGSDFSELTPLPPDLAPPLEKPNRESII